MRNVRNRILALISSFVILFSIIAVPTKASNVEAKIGEDLVKVYLKGEFDAETKGAILSKINKLRKEACDEGITLPDTGYGDIVPALGKMTLKPEDYVEAKWSNELEQIAMIRAAECIFYYSHTRPDGTRGIDTVVNGVMPSGECLAYGGILDAIDAWAAEKAKLVAANEQGVDISWNVVGHYDNIVRPHSEYVAVSSFTATGENGRKRTFAAMETGYAQSEDKIDVSQVNEVELTIPRDNVDCVIDSTENVLKKGTKTKLNFKMYFPNYGDHLLLYTKDEIAWTSSDSKVASVDNNGNVTALSPGTTTIKAVEGEFSAEIELKVIEIVSVTQPEVITIPCGTSPYPLFPKTVEVKWSDNTFSKENVNWNEMGIDYTNKAGGTFSVTGYVEGFSGAVVQKVIIKPEKTTNKTTEKSTEKNTEKNTNSASDSKTLQVNGVNYKITSKNTVAYKAPKNKNIKSVKIPEKVTINGKSYKVTSISNDALKNCKKLKEVTVGKNINTIGSNAFRNCKNLKKIVFKTKSLKKIGSNAFKGINSNAKFKLPGKKYAKYKKMIKKAKAPSKSKYVK